MYILPWMTMLTCDAAGSRLLADLSQNNLCDTCLTRRGAEHGGGDEGEETEGAHADVVVGDDLA